MDVGTIVGSTGGCFSLVPIDKSNVDPNATSDLQIEGVRWSKKSIY
jgi:hypothetical protein